MFKRKEYSERVTKTLNFESRVYSDFEKLCTEERTYPSHRLQELMVGELEKKGVGAMDPLNIRYHKPTEKPLQTGLDNWIKRSDAYENIKTMDPYLIENIGLNMVVAARFKKTGIAREVRVI
jgi:hypothetical protein